MVVLPDRGETLPVSTARVDRVDVEIAAAAEAGERDALPIG